MTYSYAASATQSTTAATVTAGATSNFNYTARGSAATGQYEASITAAGTLSATVRVEFQTSTDGTRWTVDGQGEIYFTGTDAGTYNFLFVSTAPRVRLSVINSSGSSVTVNAFENFETED